MPVPFLRLPTSREAAKSAGGEDGECTVCFPSHPRVLSFLPNSWTQQESKAAGLDFKSGPPQFTSDLAAVLFGDGGTRFEGPPSNGRRLAGHRCSEQFQGAAVRGAEGGKFGEAIAGEIDRST